MARLRPPAEVKWAAAAMLVGGVVTLGWGALVAVQALRPVSPPPPEGYGQIGAFFDGIGAGVLGSGPWLETAWLALAGRVKARTWSAICFWLYFPLSLLYLISAYSPGTPQPPPLIDGPVGVGLEWLFGLTAVVLLRRPAAAQFFRAAEQARAAGWSRP